jgi:hypothetical protein
LKKTKRGEGIVRKPILLGFTRFELILLALGCASMLFLGLAITKTLLEYSFVILAVCVLGNKLYTWIYNGDSSDGKQEKSGFYSFPGVAWLGYEKDNSSTDSPADGASSDSADSGGDSGGGDGGGE